MREPVRYDVVTCVLGGSLFAGFLTAVAICGVALGSLLSVLGAVPLEDASARAALITLVAASAGYLVAGLLGGLIFFALQGLTRHTWGRVMVGGLLGTLFYGAVATSGVISDVYLGVSFIEADTLAEGLKEVAAIAPVLGFIVGGAVALGVKERSN